MPDAYERFVAAYLRLNGYFTVPNFIVHAAGDSSRVSDGHVGNFTETDVIAVRMPYSQEITGRLRIANDPPLVEGAVGKIDVVIAEVKLGGQNKPNSVWREAKPNEAIRYIVRFIGLHPEPEIERVATALATTFRFEEETCRIRYILFCSEENRHYREKGVSHITFAQMISFILHERGQCWIREEIGVASAHHQWDEFLVRIFAIANDASSTIEERTRHIEALLRSGCDRSGFHGAANMLLPVPSSGREVGECIYCGSREEPLQKEHAIPYGLNGQWTLLRASCDDCAKLTHRFERDTLRCLWPSIRIALEMQTRRPEKRPQTLPLVLQKDGIRSTIQVPRSDYPLYLPAPLFPAPGVVAGRRLTPGVFTNLQVLHIAGPTYKQVSERFPGANFLGSHLNFSPEEFARSLAKSAFCIAVYVLGLRPFTNTPIRKVIMGTDANIGHWVGGWEGDEINPLTGLHAVQIRASGADIHVVLRLFAQFGAPEYHVALGPAAPEFVNSPEWPWP